MRKFLWVVCGLLLGVTAQAERCRILDYVEPAYQANVAFTPESDVVGLSNAYGDVATLDVDADLVFGRWADVAAGTVDLAARLRSTMFHYNASSGSELPSQVASVALDAGWNWRWSGGMGLLLEAEPGLYSDFEELNFDGFACPFAGSAVKAFNSNTSGQLGVQIRPGFDRVFIPLVGVVYANDDLRIDARIPHSRFTWYVSKQFDVFGDAEWRNTTFTVSDERDDVTTEDFRLAGGMTYRPSDELGIVAMLGRVVERSIDHGGEQAGHEDVQNLDVADAWFVKAGIEGPF